MADILRRIEAYKRVEVAAAKQRLPLSDERTLALPLAHASAITLAVTQQIDGELGLIVVDYLQLMRSDSRRVSPARGRRSRPAS